MASFVQVKDNYFANGTAATSEALAYTSQPTIGNMLFVVIGWEHGASITVTSVTDTLTNTYVSLPQATGGNHALQAFYAISNKSTGANTVTANFSGVGATFVQLTIAEYSGISSIDQHGENGGASSPQVSPTITTSKPHECILGYADDGQGNWTAGSGWTLRSSLGGINVRSTLQDILDAAPGSYTSNATSAVVNEQSIVTFLTPLSISVYSQPDCRIAPAGPNANRTVQATKIYDVQTSSNAAVPGTDSRVSPNIPVDSRANPNGSDIPQNSRTPGTYGPGVN
jgi:hypothetical protein